MFCWARDPTDAYPQRPIIVLSHDTHPFSATDCTVMCIETSSEKYQQTTPELKDEHLNGISFVDPSYVMPWALYTIAPGAIMNGKMSGKLTEDGRRLVKKPVNYPDLPRLGLPGPRLLRSELPVSVSELAGTGPPAVPDSAGDFPSQAVRSVPLLPDGHSATTDSARFLSRLNTIGSVASIVLPTSTAWVVSPCRAVKVKR